jgi:hypothetical protein
MRAKIEVVPEKFNDRVQAALDELGAIIQEAHEEAGEDGPDFFDFSRDHRWRLLTLACSLDDYIFWIEPTGNEWKATEVETGVHGKPAMTAQEALWNYWEGK